jgi:hypothetical protein
MNAKGALQIAVRGRLIGWPGLHELLPDEAILDRHRRPAPDAAVIIGEAQVRDDGDSVRRGLSRIWLDLHIWKKEVSTEGAGAIADQIRAALHSARLVMADGYHCADWRVAGERYLRDPDGERTHVVMTIEALVEHVT